MRIPLGLQPGQIPIEIIPQGPVPDYPKMVQNQLNHPVAQDDWAFHGMVQYPSGKKKYFSTMFPPGTHDQVMAVLMSLEFWDGFWHQMTIAMIKDGEVRP